MASRFKQVGFELLYEEESRTNKTCGQVMLEHLTVFFASDEPYVLYKLLILNVL